MKLCVEDGGSVPVNLSPTLPTRISNHVLWQNFLRHPNPLALFPCCSECVCNQWTRYVVFERSLKVSVADKFFITATWFYDGIREHRLGSPIYNLYLPFSRLERVAGLTSTANTSLPFPRILRRDALWQDAQNLLCVAMVCLQTILDGIYPF